jgi:hypothetical protein
VYGTPALVITPVATSTASRVRLYVYVIGCVPGPRPGVQRHDLIRGDRALHRRIVTFVGATPAGPASAGSRWNQISVRTRTVVTIHGPTPPIAWGHHAFDGLGPAAPEGRRRERAHHVLASVCGAAPVLAAEVAGRPGAQRELNDDDGFMEVNGARAPALR